MLNLRQQHCLKGIGITPWKSRESVAQVTDSSAAGIIPGPLEAEPLASPQAPVTKDLKTDATRSDSHPTTFELNDWPSIEGAIEACQNCALGKSCTRKVPGKGNQDAELMIIGEAPGHEEDMQGLPFVGRAGQLLDRMLAAIDIEPQSVFISNILKCRPPNNRDPRVEEIETCAPFLQAQITRIKPRVILSVGRISAQNLLQDQSPVGRLRGRLHTLPNTRIPLVVTYHPAYLLRNPIEKIKVWQDLKMLYRLLNDTGD